VSETSGLAVGTEPDIEGLRARAACLDVINRTLRLVDEGNATSSLALYTEDGVMQIGDDTLAGEALYEAMRGREIDGVARIHLPGQTDFELVGPREARAMTLLHLYNLDHDHSSVPAPRALTRLDDQLVRDEHGVWKLARRDVTVLADG
jgi:hypothetical protein